MNDLFQLAYLVFSNRDMAQKAERSQRNMQKAEWLQWLCSFRDHQRGSRLFWTNPALADHKAHGSPHKASVPCVDKRGTGGRTEIDVPIANSQALGEGTPQMPESDGDPSAIDGFAIRRLRGTRPKVALPRDTIDVTNVEPPAVIDVAGHLTEFLIDTGTTFSVLTQRTGNLSNHKEYVMGLSGKRHGHFPGTPFVQDQWPAVFTFLSVCAWLSHPSNRKRFMN